MVLKKSYIVSNFTELKNFIEVRKINHSETIIYLKNYLVKGFKTDWLFNTIEQIKFSNKKHKIRIFVNSGYDYGLCIMLIKNKVDYIKLNSNINVLKKIEYIARKNKVLLNPKFNIVEIPKYNFKNI